MNEKDVLMTKQEVMEYLRISHQTLFRLMKQKALPYVKLDRKVLFRKEDIQRFVESRIVK